jgi:hypothetical protein
VAAASPSGVNLSPIVEMWTTALRAGRTGKEAALHAALGVLSSPSPPSASAPTGVICMMGLDPNDPVTDSGSSMTSAAFHMPHFLTQSICFNAGASVEVLARAASEDAAWLAFQRMSAWWLGEHANVAANEFAGTSGIEADTFEDEGVIKPPSGRVEIATHNKPLSAGEVCCLPGGRLPTPQFRT